MHKVNQIIYVLYIHVCVQKYSFTNKRNRNKKSRKRINYIYIINHCNCVHVIRPFILSSLETQTIEK